MNTGDTITYMPKSSTPIVADFTMGLDYQVESVTSAFVSIKDNRGQAQWFELSTLLDHFLPILTESPWTLQDHDRSYDYGSSKKCTCGSSSVGSIHHSVWCDLC